MVGHYPDGSAVVQFNQGKHAGCLGLIEHGVNDDHLEHLVEGDVDATVAAWLEQGLLDSVSSVLFSEWVLRALLHYKGAAVERTKALNAAITAVKEAIAGDPLGVTSLDLSEKSLRALPSFLGECRNLEVLSLRENELKAVPPVLGEMKKLKELNLYYNKIDIASLPPWLCELPLRSLNLGLNEGDSLAPVLFRLKSLEDLELPDLSGLPASIGELANLRNLDIGEVKGVLEEGGLGRLLCLETLALGRIAKPLPNDVGGMCALQVLKFEVTPRDGYALPDSIAKLQSLRVLHVGASAITPALGGLKALEELKFSGNESGLPENFGALSSLRKLDLHYARMTSLPESFGDLSNLEHLNMESTYVERLPASFAKLRNLRFLNLAAAVATNVGACLASLENLEHLAIKVPILITAGDSLRNLRKLETLKVYAPSDDTTDLKTLLEFVSDLPSLKTLGIPYQYKDHFSQKFPGLNLT